MEEMDALIEVMATLRDPEQGCPWDRVQDFRSIAPHTLEEAYEVVDAIERGTAEALRDELGDLLFQVVYHTRMAEERGWFSFRDVATTLRRKLIRRHPHVFGEEAAAEAGFVGGDPNTSWERIKEAERGDEGGGSALDGVTQSLPALARAAKLQRRAARDGFDWPAPDGALGKIREELGEVEEARATGTDEELEGEIGDLLFACVNYARHLGVDPEAALRRSSHRFEERYRALENALQAQGTCAAEQDLEVLEQEWTKAKRALAMGPNGEGGQQPPAGPPPSRR